MAVRGCNSQLTDYISFSDLDGALLSGPDCDRNVSASLLAEASSGQDGGDAGRYGRVRGFANGK